MRIYVPVTFLLLHFPGEKKHFNTLLAQTLSGCFSAGFFALNHPFVAPAERKKWILVNAGWECQFELFHHNHSARACTNQ